MTQSRDDGEALDFESGCRLCALDPRSKELLDAARATVRNLEQRGLIVHRSVFRDLLERVEFLEPEVRRLTAERDKARDIACRLEQENAEALRIAQEATRAHEDGHPSNYT